MTERTVRFYGKADETQMKKPTPYKTLAVRRYVSPLQSLKQGFDHGFGRHHVHPERVVGGKGIERPPEFRLQRFGRR